MNIDNSLTKVIFSFAPAHYFLVHSKDERFGNAVDGDENPVMVWSLNPRIDMSYAGKSDQVATPVIYLTDSEAEECKKAGFTYIE